MTKQINVTCEKCKESFVFSAESSVVDKVLDEGHYICFTCEDKLELQNIKCREEIARLQKSLRKKNKSIKDLNEAVKNIKSERDEWRADANQLDKEKDEFIIENEKLKSQLQQQALPVVPSFVADWYEFHMNGTFSAVVTAYAFAGDDKAVVWIGENGGMDLLCKMKLYNYQVEKPQLFYLELPNVYGLSDPVFVSKVESRTILEFTKGKDYALTLTEQEIKSIDERYWQFAVPVEDGE